MNFFVHFPLRDKAMTAVSPVIPDKNMVRQSKKRKNMENAIVKIVIMHSRLRAKMRIYAGT